MSILNFRPHFWKNDQGYSSKFGVSAFEIESNRFETECTSICPESTWQILESQRVYLYLITVDLYVQF